MDHVAAILGLTIPTLKARKAVMKSSCRKLDLGSPNWRHHRDSLIIITKNDCLKLDDDTASTLSASDSDLSFSGSTVSFSDDLVTEVHLRPYTTMEEKYALFYNDHDYSEFRRECYSGQRRHRLVHFADSVVSEVHFIPITEDVAQMFYTEAELQEFLDEFVASLDKGFGID